MNARERAEFEHHKKAAEEQLNRMYYGVGGKNNGGNGLSMPPFLAVPNRADDKRKGGNTANPQSTSKEKSNTLPHSANQPTPPKSNSVGGNILSFLNFKGMKIDNDRLIILAICLLLAGDEVDELLMLALIYIML